MIPVARSSREFAHTVASGTCSSSDSECTLASKARWSSAFEHTVTLEDDLGTFEVKHEEAARVLRLTFALTFASIEGMTLPGILRLHDGTHPRMCWRKLNVGLSRGTAADNVECV